MKRTLIPTFLLVFGISVSAFAVPVPFNGNFYEVFPAEGISWTNARTLAQILGPGWDLATITSAAEQTFINSLLPAPGSIARGEYWLGGYQNPIGSPPAANWFWVTGEPWLYTNWGEGQPDDWVDPDFQATTQYYLAMDSDQGSWNWDDNTTTVRVVRGYIAEQSASAAPEPTTTFLFGSGLLGLWGFRRKVFKK